MKLSYDRAVIVADELILRGLDPRTIRVVAIGSNEPIAQEVYDPAKRGMNRRVEILVRESQVEDYVGQAPGALPPPSDPGS
jgi:flagellar motor protein MotB